MRARILTLAFVVSACEGSGPKRATDSRASDSPAVPASRAASGSAIAPAIAWPEDQEVYQLANLDSLGLALPRCGEAAPLSGDSVGFLRIGASLAAIAVRCPDAVPMWDWGDEGIPSPVLLIRLGDVALRLAFDDTLSSSALASVATDDSAARTTAGVGPGSSFASLTRAYGAVKLSEGECVLYATFESAPGLSFRLDTRRALDCEDIVRVADANAVRRLPQTTRVSEVFVYRP